LIQHLERVASQQSVAVTLGDLAESADASNANTTSAARDLMARRQIEAERQRAEAEAAKGRVDEEARRRAAKRRTDAARLRRDRDLAGALAALDAVLREAPEPADSHADPMP
jgi:hypothetical protein